MEQRQSRAADPGEGISLVLGGGGGRGVAHLGVLEVLEEAGIPIADITGSSAGALVGAIYLQHPTAAEARAHSLEFLASPAFQRLKLAFRVAPKDADHPAPSVVARLLSGWRRQVAMHLLFRRTSLFHTRRLEGVLAGLTSEGRVESLRLPLRIVALDVETGEEVVITEGELMPALLASCSVAGFFPPVEVEGRILIDSGMSDNLPVQVAQAGGRPVVAVNVSAQIERRRDFPTAIELMFRSEEIGSRWNSRLRARDAHVVVSPALDGRFWLDFTDPGSLVESGRQAAREALPQIQALVRNHGGSPPALP